MKTGLGNYIPASTKVVLILSLKKNNTRLRSGQVHYLFLACMLWVGKRHHTSKES